MHRCHSSRESLIRHCLVPPHLHHSRLHCYYQRVGRPKAMWPKHTNTAFASTPPLFASEGSCKVLCRYRHANHLSDMETGSPPAPNKLNIAPTTPHGDNHGVTQGAPQSRALTIAVEEESAGVAVKSTRRLTVVVPCPMVDPGARTSSLTAMWLALMANSALRNASTDAANV